MKRKELLTVVGLLLFGVGLFVPELFFFQKGFLGGDYGQQFFPYSTLYGKALKSFSFSFYTDLIGGGYNLLAEGQTGFFYPFNIILFLLFPVKIAYQLNPLIHFLLGGFFSYLFIRNKKIAPIPSFIFALLFMFGASVCGIRYNTMVQKLLVWFPLGLYFIDQFFTKQQYRYLAFVSGVFILQVYAGFLQVAAYCIGFTALYFLIKLFVGKRPQRVKALALFAVFLFIFVLGALPQIVPTLQEVSHSTRHGQGVGFSLWGSMTPAVAATFIFPRWDFLAGGSLYLTIILLPFLMLFFRSFKEAPRDIKIYFWLFVVTALFALGKYTPVLPGIVKLFGLTFLRNPSKFLFVGNVFLSACVVWSLDHFLNQPVKKFDRHWMIKWWGIGALALVVVMGAATFVLARYEQTIVAWGDEYVRTHIYGASHHRYNLEFYYAKVRSLFASLQATISLANRNNWCSLLLVAVVPLALLLKRKLSWVIMALVIGELFIFAQYSTGLKGNFISWKEYQREGEAVRFLKENAKGYRIYNFITAETESRFYERYPFLENANMVQGISSLGIYAPIVDQEYYALLQDLGAVDDSLGRKATTKETLRQNLGFLASLNVKYILSFVDLRGLGGLKKVYEQGDFKIYQIQGVLPQLSFASAIRSVASKEEAFVILKNARYNPRGYVVAFASKDLERVRFPRNGLISITEQRESMLALEVSVDRDALLIINRRYRGWGAQLDGEVVRIHPVNGILQGVRVPQGKHIVVLRYYPYCNS